MFEVGTGAPVDPVGWLGEEVLSASARHGFVTPGRRSRATRKLLDQLRAHHAGTAAHSLRVARVLMAIWGGAPETYGDAETVLLAGALHDIGKLFVPAETLSSERSLSPPEFKAIRQHPETGARVLESLGFPTAVVAAARSHHERWDGGGYPSGKPAAQMIPLVRAVAVADSFVAMVEPGRAYRAPLDRIAALAEVTRCRGTQFDPEAADLLVAAFSGEGAGRFELAIG